MNKMLLNRQEVEQLLKLMQEYECDYATLEQEEGGGIGTILTANFPVTYKGTLGEFRVEITGVGDW